MATQNAPIGLGLLDFNGRWLQVNPALRQMLGYSEEEMLALNFRDVMYAEDLDIGVAAIQSLSRGEADTFRVEKRHVHRSGRILHVQIHAALVRDSAGKPLYYLGQGGNLTERKAMEARLHEMAHYDALTGLPTRRLFLDRLQRAVSRCRRSDKLSALMYLDIDHFKQINDHLGHDTGDAVLVAFAGRSKAAVREADTVARLGGGEFTVIAEGLRDTQSAFGIADKILTKMLDEVSLGDRRFHIAMSLHFAARRPGGLAAN